MRTSLGPLSYSLPTHPSSLRLDISTSLTLRESRLLTSSLVTFQRTSKCEVSQSIRIRLTWSPARMQLHHAGVLLHDSSRGWDKSDAVR